MKRLLWITDPHFNFAAKAKIDSLILEIRESAADAVLLGGDIAEAQTFAHYLRVLANGCRIPVYFVLGNHDYYRGSIADVRAVARELTDTHERLNWLPACGAVQLTQTTSLVGHGGWGDGQIGDFLSSDVILNDYLQIQELRELQDPHTHRRRIALTPRLHDRLTALGVDAAETIRPQLAQAVKNSKEIIFLTHVPPFLESCWHEGELSDNNWSPHFTCKAVGDVLRQLMVEFPDKSMTVLCGHTHGRGTADVLANLSVVTGAAEYGSPQIQRLLVVE